MRTHVEHHILYILFEIQSINLLLKIRKEGPNYPALKKSNFLSGKMKHTGILKCSLLISTGPIHTTLALRFLL